MGNENSTSDNQHQQSSTCDSQHRSDSTQDLVLTEGLGKGPGPTCALGVSSSHGTALIAPEANSEPWTPDMLPGERRPGGASGILEMQNALGNQRVPEPPAGEVSDTPLEPGKVAGAAGETRGDVMLSSAETQARAAGDLPEAGTTGLFPSTACDWALPGSCQDPACSDRALAMEDAAALHGGSPTRHH
ncbi:Transforming acidic coiled-coil-containing protein 2 [Tupaia chinensis]|uniref:Transforming acidic coiled-coil-containing protein 2 n=1 Tax=Tupaia chinensis TaxID=246437 RepID=L9L439_TUPCH|nr:Transforming acidic coiled-coil-containing protein 2 [Tupaia chinensis]